MCKMINITDYNEKLQKEDYESIYNDIANISINLADKIAKIKNIKLSNNENIIDKLFDIEYAFKKNCASFREMIYLMRNLRNWKYDELCDEEIFIEDENNNKIVLQETKEEKIQDYIKRYNSIIVELEQYYNIEKEIKENEYNKLIKQRIEKLIQVFKEMLEFKNEKYDENWNFEQFIEKINQHYNFYSEQLSNVISIINTDKIKQLHFMHYYDNIRVPDTNIESIDYNINEEYIKINEIEAIMYLDNLYNELTCDDDYKNYADSELKEE